MSLDIYFTDNDGEDVYEANITHNLGAMAKAADIYYPLWRPEEIGIEYAHQLAPRLASGLMFMCANREECKKLNPPNGWGDFDCFVGFVADVLAACVKHPYAEIRVSR